MLICALNPCKCGWFGHPSGRCRCSSSAVSRYLSKLSGPLLDRIDLYTEVPPLDFSELSQKADGEPSSEIRRRVNLARNIQSERFGANGPFCNADMGQAELRSFCSLDSQSQEIMKGAYEHMGLTARSYDRILRLARTIADLDQEKAILPHHVAEAIQYRPPDYLKR